MRGHGCGIDGLLDIDAPEAFGKADDLAHGKVSAHEFGNRRHGFRDGGRIGGKDLAGDGLQHQALVRRAIQVSGTVFLEGIARPAQDQRLLAIKRLQAGIQMPACVLIVDFHGDVNLDAAQGIDHGSQAVHVDQTEMRDTHAGEVGHLRDRRARAADGIGRVQLLGAILTHIDHGVSGHGNQGHLLLDRIDPGEQDSIGAEYLRIGFVILPLKRGIGSQKEHVEGLLLHVRAHEHVLQLGVKALGKVLVDRLDVCEGGTGTRNQDEREHDERDLDARSALTASRIAGGTLSVGITGITLAAIIAIPIGGASVTAGAVAGLPATRIARRRPASERTRLGVFVHSRVEAGRIGIRIVAAVLIRAPSSRTTRVPMPIEAVRIAFAVLAAAVIRSVIIELAVGRCLVLVSFSSSHASYSESCLFENARTEGETTAPEG